MVAADTARGALPARLAHQRPAAEQVLLEQPFVKDPKVTVAKLVESLGRDAAIARFARIKIGDDT